MLLSMVVLKKHKEWLNMLIQKQLLNIILVDLKASTFIIGMPNQLTQPSYIQKLLLIMKVFESERFDISEYIYELTI